MASLGLQGTGAEVAGNEALAAAAPLLEAVTVPLLVVRADRILLANRAACAVLGQDESSLLRGRSLSGLLEERAEDEAAKANLVAWLLDGKAGRAGQSEPIGLRWGAKLATVVLQRRAAFPGQEEPAVVTLEPLAPPGAAMLESAELSEINRLTSVCELASGAVQAVNNPLAYITSNLTYSTERLKYISALLDDSSSMQVSEPRTLRGLLLPVLEALGEAHVGAGRATRLLKDLRSLVERDKAFGPLDVHAALEAAVNMAEAEVSRRARLRTELEARGFVLANSTRLSQLFLCLLVARAQSLPTGNAERYRIEVKSWVQGDFVLVSVADNGKAKVDLGEGNAPEQPLALPSSQIPPGILQELAHSLRGSVEFQHTEGQGTMVTVQLPLTDSSQKQQRPSLSPVRPGRRTRVLIVDNEPLIVRALCRLLRGDYDVETAGGGYEALDLIAHAGPFDLVLCDLGMPGMGGLELFRETVLLAPDMAPRFVFVTGGTLTDEDRLALAALPNHLLEKPIQPEVLREAVAGLVGAPAIADADK